MTAQTLPQAAVRFEDFYVPRFEILVSGRSLAPTVLRDVTQVTYNDSIDEIDNFDLTVGNWDDDAFAFKYTGAERSVAGDNDVQKLFLPGGADFELKIGYGSSLHTLCKGSSTSLEPNFPAGGAGTLNVRLLNVLHRLRARKHRDHWPNSRVAEGQTRISRIAQDIGERRVEGCRFPLPIRIDSAAMAREPALTYLAQDNQYDIDFLLQQARRHGYVVYVDQERSGSSVQEVLRFGPPAGRTPGVAEALYELRWGEGLIDFAPKLSMANQVASAQIRSRNRETNERIAPSVRWDDSLVSVNRDLAQVMFSGPPGVVPDSCREREEIVVNEPQFDAQQARRRAADLLSERLRQMVEATGNTVGLPDLRAGQRVQVEGFGERFSGLYFVTKTTHTINDQGYRTKFVARREARRGGAA